MSKSVALTLIARALRLLKRGSFDATDDIGQTSYFADGGDVLEAMAVLREAKKELK